MKDLGHGANVEQIEINGMQILYIHKNNMVSLIWHDDKYMMKVTLNFVVTKEECVKIIESIHNK